MKKVLLTVSAIAILAATFAGMASAGETNWIAQFTAASGGNFNAPTGSGSVAWAVSSTSAGVTDDPTVKDPRDGTPLPPGGQPVALGVWYRPEWNVGSAPLTWAATRDYRTPLQKTGDNVQIKSWDDLIVWAADGYTAPDIHIFISTPAATQALPASIAGSAPITYKMIMTHSPTSYVGQREWTITLPETVSAAYQYLDITLPSAGAIGANPIEGTGALSATQTLGYRFSFVTPEPGSMLVLASGLTGLVGLVSRRRKA